MIRHSWPEYVFIRVAILALRLVAPLSIIYLAASYYAGTFLWSPIFGVYTLIEAAFFFFVYLPRRSYMQRDTKHPPRMSRAEREALFHKCANSMTSESISSWFVSAPGRRVCRDNVIDWLLWALFSARTSEVLEEWEQELDYYISVMGEYLGYPLSPGGKSEMQCLRLTLDPVHMVHRPFVWYMIVCFVDTLVSIALYYRGFTHYNTCKWFHVFPPRPLIALFSRTSADRVTNMPYWYRPHRSHTKLPVLFIHGIGIGLLPYVPFLRELAMQDPDVGIIAIEIMPISMHITASPLASDAMCAAITRILNAHEFHRVVVAGHSYGTVVAAHLLRRQQSSLDRPSSPLTTTTTPQGAAQELEQARREPRHDDEGLGFVMAATLFIDPIPFLLHHPAVAYNFVYRRPRRANEWQLWYFASRDADIARALARHFFWFESILFREDIVLVGPVAEGEGEGANANANASEGQKKPPVAVSLSGRDQIVDACAVRSYLTGGEQEDAAGAVESPSRWAQDGLEVLYFPELDHATVFDARKDRAALLEILGRFVRLEVNGKCRGGSTDGETSGFVDVE
ncbi:hypothetical protein BJV78DRAFT_1259315 [Lactifluus subvellereus]|nr:hypothetical protein BJV78DRAFT_1259315 [Lactifluus subvellereus]